MRTPPRRLEPLTISLDLTYACGQRCPFCFISHNSVKGSGRARPSLPKLKRLVERLSDKKRCFYLAGGEPSLLPWLTELVKFIKDHGHRCLLTTSAEALTAASARRLAAAGLDDIEISLHGPAELHDRIVGMKGAFARAGRVCRALRAMPHGERPAISLWCTINRSNHLRLWDTYLALKALGPEIIAFNHLTFSPEAAVERSAGLFRVRLGAKLGLKPTAGLARGIDPRAVAAQVRRIRAAKDPAVRFDPDLTEKELLAWYDPDGEVRPRGFCVAQWSDMWVRPDGEAVPCQPLNYPLGNVYKQDPVEVFNGRRYAGLRKLLTEEGGFLPTCGRCGRSSFSSSTFGKGAGWLRRAKAPRRG